MFGRLFTLLIILAVLSLAVMFNWFDAREWVSAGLDWTQTMFESLSKTGDRLQNSIESKY
ncbi:MAG: hypothetical protein IBX48_05695 [Thiomicrospira sp.]|uniref:hypothetical protein n=1 Tax=Thiomicrospira sp. TaxID=935 RepID=UPI001A098DE4|nr:hypothetical protein [Thiomicrospira sp.]MBE0493817.1 hypothetical protein [Thiomicrospira sp.]